MSIPILPIIDPAKVDFRFATMKASQYGGLISYCAWKEVLVYLLQGRKECTIPPHTGSLTGTIAHNILDQVLKSRIQNSREFETAWDEQVIIKSAKLALDYPWLHSQPPLVDYEKKFRTKLLAERVWQKKALRGGQKSLAAQGEEEYHILGLRGRIDLVIIREGFITIIDYKTGAITGEDGYVKPEFKIQLKLYALLYQKQTGLKVTQLIVTDLRGMRYEIPFEQDDLEVLHHEILGKIQIFNDTIAVNNFASLASLSDKTCKFCQQRTVCHYYWSAGVAKPGDFEAIFRGVKTAADQSLFLHLEANGRNYYVKGLQGRQVCDFTKKVGQPLRVLNTWPANQPKLADHYYATIHTALFWVNS